MNSIIDKQSEVSSLAIVTSEEVYVPIDDAAEDARNFADDGPQDGHMYPDDGDYDPSSDF